MSNRELDLTLAVIGVGADLMNDEVEVSFVKRLSRRAGQGNDQGIGLAGVDFQRYRATEGLDGSAWIVRTVKRRSDMHNRVTRAAKVARGPRQHGGSLAGDNQRIAKLVASFENLDEAVLADSQPRLGRDLELD